MDSQTETVGYSPDAGCGTFMRDGSRFDVNCGLSAL
jgi:hypothetical protein